MEDSFDLSLGFVERLEGRSRHRRAGHVEPHHPGDKGFRLSIYRLPVEFVTDDSLCETLFFQEEAHRNRALLPFAHFCMGKVTGSTYYSSMPRER